MSRNENVSHAATVLQVSNMKTSLDFYIKALGFTLTFSWEDPMTYAVLKRGDVSIHLALNDHSIVPAASCIIYIFVYDIDKMYQECLANDVAILDAPELREYKMKDFDVKDPDGHIIAFGCEQ